MTSEPSQACVTGRCSRATRIEALSQDRGKLIERLEFAAGNPYAHGACTLSAETVEALLLVLRGGGWSRGFSRNLK
jgi:hypothetical protein